MTGLAGDGDVLDQVEEDLPYTLDVVFTATVHADRRLDLDEVVSALRDAHGLVLDAPLNGGGDITLHQLSLGRHQRSTMLLISGPCRSSRVSLDRMQEPAVCRCCKSVYDDTEDGTYAGNCPSCADALAAGRTDHEH